MCSSETLGCLTRVPRVGYTRRAALTRAPPEGEAGSGHFGLTTPSIFREPIQMQRNVPTVLRKLVPAFAVALMAAVGSACSGGGSTNGECANDPDCSSCAQDGECCTDSFNCQAGSICNLPTEDLYDATQAQNVCVRVVCQRDTDCGEGKQCSLEKVCKPPICQVNADCPQGNTCQGGECKTAPGTDQVASCEVVTRDTAIRQGSSLDLVAVARNTNGAVLPGIPFQWTSSAPGAVSVEGARATGGAEQATANLTARPMGRDVACGRQVRVTNFPNVPQGSARVVVVADDDGLPVGDAQVILEAGGTNTETTAGTGAASFNVAGEIQSVTVVKDGWQLVTVLRPGTNDIFVPLPRIPDRTVAGGFRGAVDISATKREQIRLGLAGPAIPSNLLDFGLDALIGDMVPTRIEASELGLDDTYNLPGGLMLGLGSKTFTADGTGIRCQGFEPGPNDLGCFLARSPKGPSAGWVLAGQLKLNQVTSIANELSGAIGGGGDALPIGSILTAVLPLLRSLNHGVNASVFTNEVPKVNKPGQDGNCADPTLAGYDNRCQANFSSYDRADIKASAKLNVLSSVSVPRLPALPGEGSRCAAGAVLFAGASLPGRGLVPLGITAGLDTLEDNQQPDCVVAGVKKPFGDNSPDLPDGQLPLAMAPPHSGIEGSQLFLLLLALDPDSIASETNGGFQLSALVKRGDRVAANETISGNFLPFPQATVERVGSVRIPAQQSAAVMTRVELQRGGDTWLVYAPASLETLALPDVAAGREILSNVTDAYILKMGMDGAFSDVWGFGSGKTLDRLFDTVTAFVVQECNTTAGAPCVIQ